MSSLDSVQHFPEDQLRAAISTVERIIFPTACSIAMLCNVLIILTVIWTKVNRTSRLFMILVAASDVLQAVALAGCV